MRLFQKIIILPYRTLCRLGHPATYNSATVLQESGYIPMWNWVFGTKDQKSSFMVDDRRKSKDAIAFLFFVCGIKCPNFWGQVVRAACSIDDSRET